MPSNKINKYILSSLNVICYYQRIYFLLIFLLMIIGYSTGNLYGSSRNNNNSNSHLYKQIYQENIIKENLEKFSQPLYYSVNSNKNKKNLNIYNNNNEFMPIQSQQYLTNTHKGNIVTNSNKKNNLLENSYEISKNNSKVQKSIGKSDFGKTLIFLNNGSSNNTNENDNTIITMNKMTNLKKTVSSHLNDTKESYMSIVNDTTYLTSEAKSNLNKPKNENIHNLIDKDTKIQFQNFKIFFLKYLKNMLSKIIGQGSYELLPGIRLETTKNLTTFDYNKKSNRKLFSVGRGFSIESLDKNLVVKIQEFINNYMISVNVPRAVESGRLFFFKGLKKILWPIFIGIQIAKSILLALFLPSILGSLGKIVGKGITSISGFHHPSETVGDLEFKDNTYDFDPGYMYQQQQQQQPETQESMNHYTTHMFDPTKSTNNNALSRFEFGNQNLMFINTPATNTNYYSKNPKQNGNNNLVTSGSSKNNFKIFHEIPASSLLLSNYDPFYSPLLSRLDAIFQQLGLGKGNEICREKLICLMYANPAKYAPYSNLVSAQLSRELNELRKPTTDNPDVLRFFKYMKSAKDGQDGINCEKAYESCTTFKDSENPAMLTTYHEINKLVQARKLSKK